MNTYTINDFIGGALENDPITFNDKFRIIKHSKYSPIYPCDVINGVTAGAIRRSEGEMEQVGWFWPESAQSSWHGRYVPGCEFNAQMPLMYTGLPYNDNPQFRGQIGDIFDIYTRDGVKITFQLTANIGVCDWRDFYYNILSYVNRRYAHIVNQS
ncbi:hypothetical protein F-LCD7_0339 [Faustovirus]|nr:hypothetical protein F-LCD7_0339 [Faustovirus]SMH63599.1 Hypothetical protein FSTVLC9_117 [Faustovirus]